MLYISYDKKGSITNVSNQVVEDAVSVTEEEWKNFAKEANADAHKTLKVVKGTLIVVTIK